VHDGTLLNPARRGRVALVVILCAFGVGFSTGMLTTRLSQEPDSSTEVLASQDSGLAPDGLLGDAGAAPEAAPAAAELAAAAGPRTVPPAIVPPPPSLPSQSLRSQIDSLASDAEVTQEARLTKAALPRPDWSVEQVTVQRGDTLMDILDRAGIEQGQAAAAVQSLRSVYDPRRLRTGQELMITASARETDGDNPKRLIGLALDLNFDHSVRVTRNADGSYASAKVDRPQQRQMVLRLGTIEDSLYVAAAHAEVPPETIAELIKVFSWDVDFQRDIQPGDGFESLFEEVQLQDSEDSVRGGDLIYARLTLSGRDLEAYRFTLPDGSVEYYDRNGKSLRKFLLRTPVDGARISSRFGMRVNPILGYSMMHRGVDFAAPSGTPIYAAGNGRVVEAGRKGSYGNYIQIRHNGEYSTAYAHMSRFAKGMSAGRRVVQGQVIGYIGTTGRSTGPHLHFEVLKDGSQINPLNVKQVALGQLTGKDLERFRGEMVRIDRMRRDIADGTQVASQVN
jgi:murein DD-endopeptidase MepM/ murein hydrolase activator NlpD